MSRRRLSERTVGAFEAKTHLSRYVADAAKGIVTVVTVRGRPVAKIAPADAEILAPAVEAENLIHRAREIRRRARRGPDSLHQLVSAGRR
jgi:prevent-host-death family protein